MKCILPPTATTVESKQEREDDIYALRPQYQLCGYSCRLSLPSLSILSPLLVRRGGGKGQEIIHRGTKTNIRHHKAPFRPLGLYIPARILHIPYDLPSIQSRLFVVVYMSLAPYKLNRNVAFFKVISICN